MSLILNIIVKSVEENEKGVIIISSGLLKCVSN